MSHKTSPYRVDACEVRLSLFTFNKSKTDELNF